MDYTKLGKNPDREAMAQAKRNWDAIAKPLNGLGKLEELFVRIAGIQGSADVRIQKRAVLVFCGDNGVTKQGVTQTDSHVTALVADNIADGKASVNRMCSRCDTDVFAIDVGIAGPVRSSHIIRERIADGTKDFAAEPAMSAEQAEQAIQTGIRMVKRFRDEGYAILATGEMGIGNTTTSSAVAAALLGMKAEDVTGRGAGLSTEGLMRKRTVIAEALKKYGFDDRDVPDAFTVLCTVGGFDIAAIAGAFIGGAMYGVPIVIDGLISVVGALVASRLCPASREVMIPSHMSKEPCTVKIMEELKLSPIIHGELALGEGTGAALLFPMLDMAEAVYRNDETFDKLAIPAYQSYEE